MTNIWELDGNYAGGTLDVFAINKALGNYRVAMIECDDDTVSEDCVMANAHLIAAAPDLLEASEQMLDALAEVLNFLSTDAIEHIKPILNRAEAAITKATGQ